MKYNKKEIILFIATVLLTIITGIIMINVFTGNLGGGEMWRIISSVSGFILILVFTLLTASKVFKK